MTWYSFLKRWALAFLFTVSALAQTYTLTPITPSVGTLNGISTQVSAGAIQITSTLPGATASGSVRLELPATVPAVTPCDIICMPDMDLKVTHTLTGFRQVTFQVGFQERCSGSGGFGFVDRNEFTCRLFDNRVQESPFGVRVFLTLQRAVGDPTVSLNITFRWDVGGARDRITSLLSLPTDGSLLFAGAKATIFAAVAYELASENRGDVLLQLINPADGKVVAQSARFPIAERGIGALGSQGGLAILPSDFDFLGIPNDVSDLVLKALLTSGGKKLAEVNVASYRVNLPPDTRIRFSTFDCLDDDDFIEKPTLISGATNSDVSCIEFSVNSPALSPNDEVAVDLHGYLRPFNNFFAQHFTMVRQSKIIRVGQPLHLQYPGGLFVNYGMEGIFFEAKVLLPTGQVYWSGVQGSSASIPVMNAKYFGNEKQVLQPGGPNEVDVDISWNQQQPSILKHIFRCLAFDTDGSRSPVDCSTQITSDGESLLDLTRGRRDRFVVVPLQGATDLVVYYQFAVGERLAKSQEVYFKVNQIVRLVPGTMVQASRATLQVASNSSGVDAAGSTTSAAGLASRSFVDVSTGTATSSARKAPAAAKTPFPEALADGWIGINRIWQFDPSIPKNGSFRSSLTLQFSNSDLPNDPNMDVSKLEIVAYDPATGSMDRIATTIDATTGTATGQIDGLAPVYTLAVFAPFTKKGLAASAISEGGSAAKMTLVNLDSSAAAVNVELPSKFTKSVSANQALVTTAGDLAGNPAAGMNWLLASGPAAIAGAYKISLGPKAGFDFLEMAASPLTHAVVPEVVHSDLVSTTLQIANPNPFPARATVALHHGNGTLVDSIPVPIEPSAGLSLQLEGNFPNLTKPFTGYAVLKSDQSLYSSAIFEAAIGGSIAGLNAVQPGSLPSRSAIPLPGADASGILSIVNTGSSDLRFLATLYAENGSRAQGFTPSNVTLPPGEQYRAGIADIFPGAAFPTTGSIVIERASGAGAGAVIVSGVLMSKVAALPIDRPAQSRLVIPLPDATMPATIQLFSSGPAASAVVTSLQANGTVLNSTRATIPANGSSSTQLAASTAPAYVRIESDQPVNASALMTAADGSAETGLLPAQPVFGSSVNPPIGNTPAITVSPESLAFDSVNVGLANDQSIAVRNTGNANLRVTSVVSSNARFAVLSPAGAFDVAAGSVQNLSIRFSPNAAGSQTGTITINSNDPARPSAVVNVSGTGIASAQPAITVSPTSLAFGSVTVSQPRELSLQVSNTGSAALSVNATLSGTGFSLVTPSSFTIQSGGAAQTVTVRYSPSTAGASAGTLTLTSNDPTRPTTAVSLTGIGTASVGGGGTGANLLCNGSFEQPGHSSDYVTLVAGGNLPCWNITAGNLDLIGAYWQHSDGRFSLDMNGTLPATINQTFATSAGADYTVSFDLAGNPTGPPSRRIEVSAGGQTAVKTSTNAQRSFTNMGWQRETFQFTASGNSTTLQFRSLEENSPYGPALDNVCVTAGTSTCAGGGSGSGQPAIAVSQTSLEFGSVTLLQTRDRSLQVSNTGSAALTVNISVSAGSGFTLVSPASFTIQAGGAAQTVTVRYSPFAPIAATGTLTIASNDPARPATSVPLTGTGATGTGGGGGSTVKISVSTAAGWPNGRISNQLPALAIDGSISTYTWTTEAFASARPSYLGIGFAAAANVNRIRIYKDNDSGGAGPVAKDLVIEYTTSSTSTPLASRTWTRVTGLTNGFNGAELLTATAVNANGSVSADNHISQVSGFASLTFNTVNATGIRIGFSNVTTLSQNHYRVYEIEAHGPQ